MSCSLCRAGKSPLTAPTLFFDLLESDEVVVNVMTEPLGWLPTTPFAAIAGTDGGARVLQGVRGWPKGGMSICTERRLGVVLLFAQA
jgi:hypothetical protein